MTKMKRNIYKLTTEETVENYNKLYKILKDHLGKSDRWEAIDKMLKAIETDLANCPSSSRDHGSYMGGLVEHIMDVISYIVLIRKVYERDGLEVPSEESCIFVAAFHDIGKVSDGEELHYVPQDSDWHRDNLGQNFLINEELETGLEHCDKSLFLLQRFGVPVSLQEFQAIRIHDGGAAGMNQTRTYGYSDNICLLSEITRTSDMMAATLRKHTDLQEHRRK